MIDLDLFFTSNKCHHIGTTFQLFVNENETIRAVLVRELEAIGRPFHSFLLMIWEKSTSYMERERASIRSFMLYFSIEIDQ